MHTLKISESNKKIKNKNKIKFKKLPLVNQQQERFPDVNTNTEVLIKPSENSLFLIEASKNFLCMSYFYALHLEIVRQTQILTDKFNNQCQSSQILCNVRADVSSEHRFSMIYLISIFKKRRKNSAEKFSTRLIMFYFV